MKFNNCYLGIDIGSISTKGVVLDDENKIYAQQYIWTEGNPIQAVKELLTLIEKQLKRQSVRIVGVGTTGSARELIGALLSASIVKNEITAHAIGTLNYHPDVQTIFEIGGQDSKIIILKNGLVVDYAMNTLCAAGTGAFLSAQARRLSIPVEKFGKLALQSTNPTKIAGRCTVFAESDLVHKAQMGYPTKDIVAGLCNSIVYNYLNNVGKGKTIEPPIVFQGGVSKNLGVVKSFESIVGQKVIIDELGHLMGAIGIAILARSNGKKQLFNFSVKDARFETMGIECGGCPNNCEIVCVLKDGKLLDVWGNRCPNGRERAIERLSQRKTASKTTFITHIMEKKRIAQNTFEFTIKKPAGFNSKPGQFAFVNLPQLTDFGSAEAMRAMSLIPAGKKIAFATRLSPSLFKQTLNKMPIGSAIELEGPFGTLKHKKQFDAVFLAGGIGVAPFIPMIRQALQSKLTKKVYLFFCDKNPASAPYFKELQNIKHKNFIFVPFMTQVSRLLAWKGEKGRISKQALQKYLPSTLAKHFYIIGRPEMVQSLLNILIDMKIEKHNIQIEQFSE